MRKIISLVSLGLATSLVLSACGGGNGDSPTDTPADNDTETEGSGAGSAEGEPGGTAYHLLANDYSYLDPAKGFDGGVNNFYRLLYRTLTTESPVDADGNSEIIPDLATDLGTPNEDATEWTFTLKDDIYFDNGDPITSADVKFGVERSLDPELRIGSPWAANLIEGAEDYEGIFKAGEGLDSIQTPDDKTIVFTLNRPFADFSSTVAQAVFTPFPEGEVGPNDIETTTVSSGPYVVSEYVRGSSLKLDRNEHWTPETDEARTAMPDNWEFVIGLDPATIDERMLAGQDRDINAFSGNIQAASVARVQSPDVQERMVSSIQGCTTYMAMNTETDVFEQLEVRQAVSYAINKKTLQDGVGGPMMADIAHTILPPTMPGFSDANVYGSENDEGDLDKARELLEEAGMADGFSFVLDLRNQPKMQAWGEAIQQALAPLNIEVELNIIDVSTYYEVIGTMDQQNDAQITGWCPDWNSGYTFLPPLFKSEMLQPKGNANLARLQEPELDEKAEEISAITDVDEQNEAWAEFDAWILENHAPIVPLLFERVNVILGENVAYAAAHPLFSGGVDFATVSLVDPTR